MANFQTAQKLAELALERVGAKSIYDRSADPIQFSRTLDRLDALVGQLTGAQPCLWLVKENVEVPLSANVADFDLVEQSAGAIEAKSFQFLVSAGVRTAANADILPLQVLYKQQYDAIEDKASTGIPCAIFLDRQTPAPRVFLNPVIATTGATLVLGFQRYTRDLTRLNNASVELDAAWNRWAEYQLAVDIGTGPVCNRDPAKIKQWRGEATEAKRLLDAYNNRQPAVPKRTQYRDY